MSTSRPSSLRSAQVAQAAGVKQQTLRYYERRGLLAEPARSTGGHRLYPPEAVTVLRVIKAAQRLGFSLDEVTDLLPTGRHRHGHLDAGFQAHAAAKIAEIEARIADLNLIRASLANAMEAGCDDLMTCATTDGCPLPFAEIARLPAESSSDPLLETAANLECTVPDVNVEN
jgi:MerR family transcriptional regulator, mercuric resistance operon regulatory protein